MRKPLRIFDGSLKSLMNHLRVVVVDAPTGRVLRGCDQPTPVRVFDPCERIVSIVASCLCVVAVFGVATIVFGHRA